MIKYFPPHCKQYLDSDFCSEGSITTIVIITSLINNQKGISLYNILPLKYIIINSMMASNTATKTNLSDKNALYSFPLSVIFSSLTGLLHIILSKQIRNTRIHIVNVNENRINS